MSELKKVGLAVAIAFFPVWFPPAFVVGAALYAIGRAFPSRGGA